jgi:hypothetical protein
MSLGVLVGGVIGGVAVGTIGPAEIQNIIGQCAQFQMESTAKIMQAVNEVNAPLSPPRIFFADPMFGPDNAVLAPHAFLFGINLDLSPQDEAEVSGPRSTVCVAAGPARTSVEVCKRASVGHPNPRGAERFAEAIIPLLP